MASTLFRLAHEMRALVNINDDLGQPAVLHTPSRPADLAELTQAACTAAATALQGSILAAAAPTAYGGLCYCCAVLCCDVL